MKIRMSVPLAILFGTLGSAAPAAPMVPFDVQVPLLLKALTYDRNLKARAGDHVRIAVVSPAKAGRAAAEDLLASIEALPDRTVNGLPVTFKELAESLRHVTVTDTTGVADELAEPAGIDRVIRRLVPADGQLLLVVDQLEELFTMASQEDQRAFLDGVVTSVLTPEGDGRWLETPGSYSDYLSQKKPEAPKPAPAAAKTPAVQSAPKPASKLGYKDQRRLEELNRLMPQVQAEIAALEAAMADPGLFSKQPEEFARKARRLEAARAELESHELEWLDLEEKREALARG